MAEYSKQFEVCVRAVIIKTGKILVCWHKINKHYFFPGGHVEYGESAEKALARELKEELDIKVKKISFMGVGENVYRRGKKRHHEINLVFQVFADKVKDRSQEDYMDFFLFSRKEFTEKQVLPLSLQKRVIKWFNNKRLFWIGKIRD